MSMDNQLIAAIFAYLNGDTALKTSGINPTTGATRNVAVYGQPQQNAALPFVRITLTDTLPVDDEPMDHATQPSAENLNLLLNVFSDYEPETRAIAARLKTLLKHHQFTTADYHGWTWFTSCIYTTDNITDPERVIRQATLRVRVMMEPV